MKKVGLSKAKRLFIGTGSPLRAVADNQAFLFAVNALQETQTLHGNGEPADISSRQHSEKRFA
jgi:hypothetical protein